MSDISQNALITTVHDLGTMRTPRLEEILEDATREYKIGLVLPVTAADARAEPFAHIVARLAEVRYLDTIVVALGQAPSKSDFYATQDRIRPLGDKAEVLWTDGPRIRELYDNLNDMGYNVSVSGKGRSVWTAIGWLLADPTLRVFTSHDCDIVNYDRVIPARLCLPIVHPELGFEFAKAYYTRCTDRMYGRVARLLMMPLLRAMPSVFGHHEFIMFLRGFRYLLSGEVAFTSKLARSLRVASHWGLEVAMLDEVYSNTPLEAVCQVDLCVPYEHKHQSLSLDDPGKGLMRMATDVLTTIFHCMASRGRALNPDHVEKLRYEYLHAAQDMIEKYRADALINGLDFVGRTEKTAVEGFARQFRTAAEGLQTHPPRSFMIPSWKSVSDAFPRFNEELREATAADARALPRAVMLATP